MLELRTATLTRHTGETLIGLCDRNRWGVYPDPTQPTIGKGYVTVGQAAEILGVDYQTVERLAAPVEGNLFAGTGNPVKLKVLTLGQLENLVKD